MNHIDLKDKKDKLHCCFCRNSLTNDDGIVIKEYQGDFVSVWCKPCSERDDKVWGPKFLICCCSEEPKELDIEMAKGEITQGFTAYSDPDTINKLNIENDKRILESMKVDIDKLGFKDEETGNTPTKRKNRKMYNL